MPFQAVDPTSGKVLRTEAPMEVSEALHRAALSREAFLGWRATSFLERAGTLSEAAAILRGDLPRWARLMADEMGKPVAQGRSEAEKCAWVLEYYAEHGAAFLADRRVEGIEGARAYWCHEPLGTVLAIMPWNFPFWQVFRMAAPTLMAGNAVLLKHAPNVPGCAEAVTGILQQAGLPPNLFQNLLVEVDDVDAVLAHEAVRAVTLTGSVRAGRAVAERAGARLKPCVLELGGSDPYVVLSDADVERAVEAAVSARILNAGQSCISSKRMIVVDEHHRAFLDAVIERMDAVRVGDPREEATEMGPMARVDLRDTLHAQVQRSVAQGARVHLGGVVPEGAGAWYPPTVLSDVGPGMPAYHEELFGPVAVVIRAADDDEALRMANDTAFGLGAAVFTRDRERGEALARRELDAGACFVNDFVRSDPRLPFGGVKESGYGRELSPLGITAFTNVKTVWVAD